MLMKNALLWIFLSSKYYVKNQHCDSKSVKAGRSIHDEKTFTTSGWDKGVMTELPRQPTHAGARRQKIGVPMYKMGM